MSVLLSDSVSSSSLHIEGALPSFSLETSPRGKKILSLQQELYQHNVYSLITDLASLKIFMEYHVFAVFDFMSLLKSLQRHLTCITVPWKPSLYPGSIVRFVNELVRDEESDLILDNEGKELFVGSHFSLYLLAMKEIGASSLGVSNFAETSKDQSLPAIIQELLRYHISLSNFGPIEEIAASFFYGREQIIPNFLEGILKQIEAHNIVAPFLVAYIKRHIHLDGEDHSHFAESILNITCDHDPIKIDKACAAAIKSLDLRKKMMDSVQHDILELRKREGN